MTEIVVEVPVETVIETISSPITVEAVTGTATVVETTAATIVDVTSSASATATVEAPAQSAIELEVTDGITTLVESTTGPTGRTPAAYAGAAPPSEAVGLPGDMYLVNTGGTIGDFYSKTLAGWGSPLVNLRGGIASVNGISGTNITLGANNITTGVLPIAQVPTGTTGTTVALGNHNHSGVYQPVGSYEPAITGGLTTQYWRGDKSWQTLDKAAVGLGNVANVDTTNASNISAGTLPFARIPTGTTSSTVAIGDHNHDTVYVALTGTQTIAGAKTFSTKLVIDQATAVALDVKGGASDEVRIAFFGQASAQTTRSAYVGFTGAASTTFAVVNERTNGSVNITPNGTGVVTLGGARTDVTTALTTPALRVGTTATAGYVLTADASGNATWQQTANIIVPGTTSQYYRGDLTWQTLDKAAVGLGNVTNAAQVELTGNQTVAGTKSFTSEIVGPTTGNVLKIGDDARLADINVANLVAIVGQQDSSQGVIGFGSTGGVKISGTNTGVATITASGGLTVSAGLSVSGTISGNGSGLTALPGANITGTINVAQIPTGTSGTTVALGNHAHTGVYEPVLAAGTTAQYYRGDKTWVALNATAVGLGNVSNTAQVDLTSGQTITGAKVMNNASNSFTGSGAGLTALNASNLSTGTVPQARIIPNLQRFISTTGAEARPTGTTYVEWVGPVTPANASNDDTWVDTSSPTIEDPIVGVPIGTIQMYAGSGAPTNWLVCDGQAVSRSTYATLFALINITYGAGDGSTTFNLPNLKGRVPVGLNSADAEFNTMGETGGEKAHTLTTAEMPAHTHQENPEVWANINGTRFHSPGTSGSFYINTVSIGGRANILTGSAGSDGAHNNLQPYITIQFIIKVL